MITFFAPLRVFRIMLRVISLEILVVVYILVVESSPCLSLLFFVAVTESEETPNSFLFRFEKQRMQTMRSLMATSGRIGWISEQ